MSLEEFEPIISEVKPEWANSDSQPLRRFLFHVHAPDPSRLRIHVTDFYCSTWEAVRSVSQLEDMRDNIGVGGSWSDFVDYIIASTKSEDVKLVMEGHPDSDGAAYAKLVGQKSKGMPLISISLTKLVDSAASEAMANMSLELLKSLKSVQNLLVEEQQRSCQLTKVISTEKERNENIQNQLEPCSKRQKFQKLNGSDQEELSPPLMSNGLQNSPKKLPARDSVSTRVSNRVVPAYRRAKVRGASLHDTEDEKDN